MLTYTPDGAAGAGYAIAAERAIALVGPDTSLDVALTVYRQFSDPGTPLSATLDLLRESTVCVRFAVIELDPGATTRATIALRGDISVDLGSAATSRFTWAEGATWVTAVAEDLDVLRLSLGQAPAADPTLPFSTGVVKASDLVVSLHDLAMPAGTHLPAALGDDAEDEDERELTVLLEETVARSARKQRLDAPDGLRSEPRVPADTGVVPEKSRPASASNPPPRTPQRVDLSSLMQPVTWTLRLPDGNELEAASSIVVGRRPWRSDPDETSTYYIVAPSPHREISGKHLEFAVVGGALVARDLESTNGTLVLAPDKPPRLLADGRTVHLDTGDTLDLGEGFQIVVGERR